MKLELTEGDSLEVSDDTPMYNTQYSYSPFNQKFFPKIRGFSGQSKLGNIIIVTFIPFCVG